MPWSGRWFRWPALSTMPSWWAGCGRAGRRAVHGHRSAYRLRESDNARSAECVSLAREDEEVRPLLPVDDSLARIASIHRQQHALRPIDRDLLQACRPQRIREDQRGAPVDLLTDCRGLLRAHASDFPAGLTT